jgi:hypothetical protein
MKKFSISSLVMLLPFAVLAHEGHGVGHGTVWHYIASFWHLLPLALSVVVIVFLVKRLITSKNKSENA